MSEIRVGVKLEMGDVKAQAAKVGQEVKKAVESATGSSGAPGGLASGEVSGGLARMIGRSRWQQQVRDAAAAQARAAREAAQQARQQTRNAALTAGGAFAGRFGLSGLATTARQGPLGLAVAAVVASLLAVSKAANEVSRALKDASQRYAKQLTTGLPGSFTTQRSLLAEVIGVSEMEVLRYGKAVEALSERLRLSGEEMHRTTRILTQTQWNLRVLGINFRALWSQIAAVMAPAINMFANFLSAWVQFVREIGWGQAVAHSVAIMMKVLATALVALYLPLAAAVTAVVALGDAIQYFVRQVRNSIMRATGQEDEVSNEDVFRETKLAWESMAQMMRSLGKASTNGVAPTPTTDYSKLQASAWERMGLVVGPGIGVHPLRDIAKNTRKTADLLQQIKNFRMPQADSLTKLPKETINSP